MHSDINPMFPTGAQVVMAGQTKLPFGQVPLLLHNGEVSLQTSSGKVQPLMLDSHNKDERPQDMSQEEVRIKHIQSNLFMT